MLVLDYTLTCKNFNFSVKEKGQEYLHATNIFHPNDLVLSFIFNNLLLPAVLFIVPLNCFYCDDCDGIPSR